MEKIELPAAMVHINHMMYLKNVAYTEYYYLVLCALLFHLFLHTVLCIIRTENEHHACISITSSGRNSTLIRN